MAWFNKRKEKNLIPPIEGDSPNSYRSTSTPPVRSAATTYVASRDDPYSSRSAANTPPAEGYQPVRDRYQRNNGVGDVYSRGGRDPNSDRDALFAGYKRPAEGAPNRFSDGPAQSEENDEDVEGIKQNIRSLKQESVNSTRNALRLAREAEETARNTVNKLGDQSEKLANTERHLDVAKGHSQKAEDRTDELKQLNRSIFRPVIHFNKDAKRAAQEAKVQDRYDEEREEREKAMMDIRDTQNRLGRATTYGRGDEEEGIGGSRRGKTGAQQALRQEQRKRYQFEATASDDEAEDELDDNLDEISDMTKRLKALGSAMGQELDKQNNRIERIEEKTTNLDNRVYRNTERLKRIK